MLGGGGGGGEHSAVLIDSLKYWTLWIGQEGLKNQIQDYIGNFILFHLFIQYKIFEKVKKAIRDNCFFGSTCPKGQVERHIMLECWYPDWYISNTTKF